MVDGVLASCYAEYPHDVSHLTITPFQKFPVVMEWIFGNDPGLPIYVGDAKKLSTLIMPNGQYWSH